MQIDLMLEWNYIANPRNELQRINAYSDVVFFNSNT